MRDREARPNLLTGKHKRPLSTSRGRSKTFVKCKLEPGEPYHAQRRSTVTAQCHIAPSAPAVSRVNTTKGGTDMGGKNKGGREARKPKQNKKVKGQTPPPGGTAVTPPLIKPPAK